MVETRELPEPYLYSQAASRKKDYSLAKYIAEVNGLYPQSEPEMN